MVNPVREFRDGSHAEVVEIHYGEEWEQRMSYACQWFALVASVILILWYTKQTYRRQCGWEEFYVCTVETIKVVLDMNVAFKTPATIYQFTGVVTHWLRYCEWLLTCPVILIHLSNLTGLDGEYSKRSMTLLVSDVGTIVMGVSSALSKQGYLKVIFFMIGLTYGANTYFSAAQAFVEGYNKVPKGRCKVLVKAMAVCFFGSWIWYPILFMLGPEGFGHLSIAGSDIAHTFVDMLSKNSFGIIRKYILKHGELKKPKRGAVGLFGGSATFDDLEEFEPTTGVKAAAKSGHKGGSQEEIGPGLILLGVQDASLIRYLQDLFLRLDAKLTVMPTIGSENVMQMAQSLDPATVDYVLLDAELVADTQLLSFLKSTCNFRVCSFGWAVDSPHKEVLETAPLDGLLEGPSFGRGVDVADLASLTAEMQKQKRRGIATFEPPLPPMGYNQGAAPQAYSPQQIQVEAETVQQLLHDIHSLKRELNN